MRKLPKQHIRLFIILAFTLLATLILYYVFINPKATTINNLKEEYNLKKSVLIKTKWPLDQNRLNFLLASKQKQLKGGEKSNGLEKQMKITMNLATEMFNNNIKQFFSNPSDFVTDISLLDYQEEYNKLEQKLNSRYIFLSENITHIGENTINEKMYKPLLQVWTLSMLTDILSKAQLRLLKSKKIFIKQENGYSQRASLIQLQPIRQYFLYDDDAKPYLFEIPIRFTCTGSIEQLSHFLKIIQTKPYFLPVSHLQIKSSPRAQYQGNNYLIRTKMLIFEIECCSFFRPNLKKIPQKRKEKTVKALPAGA
jgi:Tfp pilus assembly protein PilO